MTITRAQPPLSSRGREAVFVDAACADLMQILAGRNDGREIIPLDSSMPLAEMAAWAVGRSGYAAIHIVSHGAPGRLFLGPMVLDADAARLHASELATLGAALDAHGSVLLYGCDVAHGAGADFADLLAGLLGASVAASTTPTGAAALGGDWELAWTSGPVHAAPLRLDAWHGVLVAPQLQAVTAYSNQRVITLTYDQPLDAFNPPPLGVFLAQNIPTPGGYGEGQITITAPTSTSPASPYPATPS